MTYKISATVYLTMYGVPVSKLLFSASHKHTGDCNQNPKLEPLQSVI